MSKTFYQKPSTNIFYRKYPLQAIKVHTKRQKIFNALIYLIFLQNEKNVFIGANRNHRPRYVFQQQKPPRACLTYFLLNRTQYLLAYMYRLKGINNGVANVCLAYEG